MRPAAVSETHGSGRTPTRGRTFAPTLHAREYAASCGDATSRATRMCATGPPAAPRRSLHRPPAPPGAHTHSSPRGLMCVRRVAHLRAPFDRRWVLTFTLTLTRTLTLKPTLTHSHCAGMACTTDTFRSSGWVGSSGWVALQLAEGTRSPRSDRVGQQRSSWPRMLLTPAGHRRHPAPPTTRMSAHGDAPVQPAHHTACGASFSDPPEASAPFTLTRTITLTLTTTITIHNYVHTHTHTHTHTYRSDTLEASS